MKIYVIKSNNMPRERTKSGMSKRSMYSQPQIEGIWNFNGSWKRHAANFATTLRVQTQVSRGVITWLVSIRCSIGLLVCVYMVYPAKIQVGLTPSIFHYVKRSASYCVESVFFVKQFWECTPPPTPQRPKPRSFWTHQWILTHYAPPPDPMLTRQPRTSACRFCTRWERRPNTGTARRASSTPTWYRAWCRNPTDSGAR